MANLEIRFQAPLTRPGIKLEKITSGVGGGEGKKLKKNHTWPESTLWRCLIERKNFWLHNNDEKQKALMVEGMKLVIWNHQELKSN